MIYPSSERKLGMLHIRVRDEWTVKEFTTILTRIADGYEPLDQLDVLGGVLRDESKSKPIEPVWTTLYRNDSRMPPFGRSFEEILQSVSSFSCPLIVGGIKISSPGWIELIGNLNPLKVASDFITKYRAENTKRAKLQSDAHIAQQHEITERFRIRAEFAARVLELMPEGSR